MNDTQTRTERDPILERVVGRWKGDGGDVVIEAPGGRNGLVMRGRHADWKGRCEPGPDDETTLVNLTRRPTAAEMSTEAPEWARQEVAGSLEWELDLEACRDCADRTLRGSWFPAEIRWTED